MRKSLSIGSEAQRAHHADSLKAERPPIGTHIDNRQSAAVQRQLITAMSNSPQVVAQRRISQKMHNGSRMLVQRRMLAGESVQRIEEEESLQKKSAPLQRIEEEESLQKKSSLIQRVEEDELMQGKFTARATAQLEQQSAKQNETGLPDNLKSGIESLSGISMDSVRVHYNSSQPAQLNALAYAQGTDIHVAPGQEKHLPHEAWHVVQQAQGRVQPTMQMQEGIPVNDDQGLEREADVMGAKAAVHSG